MLAYLLLFWNNFFWIGLRSFQQLNVVYENYKAMAVTSCLLAVCEVYIIAAIATSGTLWIPMVVMAISGYLGNVGAIQLSKRLRDKDASV